MAKKILIAEDSATMRYLIMSTIAALGDFEIVEAANGFEALRVLPREKVDLVITDINMPDINGLELINFVKKNPNYRETPLFVVTTEGRDQDRQRGLQLGASEYVVKPFAPEAIAELVRRYLKL